MREAIRVGTKVVDVDSSWGLSEALCKASSGRSKPRSLTEQKSEGTSPKDVRVSTRFHRQAAGDSATGATATLPPRLEVSTSRGGGGRPESSMQGLFKDCRVVRETRLEQTALHFGVELGPEQSRDRVGEDFFRATERRHRLEMWISGSLAQGRLSRTELPISGRRSRLTVEVSPTSRGSCRGGISVVEASTSRLREVRSKRFGMQRTPVPSAPSGLVLLALRCRTNQLDR